MAKLGDGRKENFVDSINIDELEQRSIEHRSKTVCLTLYLWILTYFIFFPFCFHRRLKILHV